MRRLVWLLLAAGCEPGVTAGDDEEAEAALTRAFEAQDRCAWTEAEPHFRAAIAALGERQPGSLAHRRALRELADHYRDMARWEDARTVLDEARALTPAESDAEGVQLACSTASVSLHHEEADEAEKAIAQLGPVADLDARARLAGIRSAIAEMRGQYGEARRQAEQMLELRRSQGKTLSILWATNRVGRTMEADGDAAGAEKLFAAGLNQLDAAHDLPYTCEREDLQLFLVHHLALSFWDQGRTSDAAPLYQMVLDDDEVRLGANHPETAIELYSVALTYMADGDNQRAQPMLERALDIETRSFGGSTPRIIPTLTALARTVEENDDFVRAEALFQRAVDIWEAMPGSKSTWGVGAHEDLGHLLAREGRNDEARQHFLRAQEYLHLSPANAEGIRWGLESVSSQ
jgi:tetratricopeptide (TPR) repeat protein